MEKKEWIQYPSVAKFLKLYDRGRITTTTLNSYVKSVAQFCEMIGYDEPEECLKHIASKEKKEQYLDSLITKFQDNVSNTRIVSIMKAVRKWLDLNKVDVEWRDIILPSVEIKEEDRAPTNEELRRLLAVCNIRDRAIILVDTSSGLRRKALVTLTFGDVNFDYPDVARIVVKKQYAIRGKTFKSGRKISRKRTFFVTFITPEAKQALLDYKKYREEMGETITEESPLFTSTRQKELGKFLSAQYLDVHWGRLLKKAHLTDKSTDWFIIHLHTLKKYAETRFIDAGCKPSYREFWLGHSGSYLESAYFRGEEKQHLEEYRKAIPHLQIEKPSEPQIAEAVARIEVALGGHSVEDQKRMLKAYLENLPAMVRSEVKKKVRLENIPARERNGGTNCQAIITESELEDYLRKGYRFVSILPSGKIVVES